MDIYARLGLEPIVNAWGTLTTLGGSRMHPEVLTAMEEASRSFIDVVELHRAAGEAIARTLAVEAACVTSGAAAGLAVASAACMTRGDRAKALQLPNTSGMRDEVLILKAHRFPYDQAVLLSGARFTEIGWTTSVLPEQVEAAVTERTAMFLYVAESEAVRGSLPLASVTAIMSRHGIPVVVDAAAEAPPLERIPSYLEQGASLVVVSGGKEIGGPQSSGMILGTSEMIDWCVANNFPNGGVGRAMKTDKETIAGLVRAVELFASRDYDAVFIMWEEVVARLMAEVSMLPDVHVRRGFPVAPGVQPVTIPRMYAHFRHLNAPDVQHALRTDHSIAVGVERDEIVINPQCLAEDEIPVIVAALGQIAHAATEGEHHP